MFVNIQMNDVVALTSAFVFGIITIEILLRIVKNIRFSYFVGGFAIIILLIEII